MPQPPLNKLFFSLTPEVENEIANDVIDNMLLEIQEDIERAFPDDMLPTMVELPPEQRAEAYGRMTDPRDVDLIRDKNYLENLEAGRARMLVSPAWRQMAIFPDIFLEAQKDFIKVTA